MRTSRRGRHSRGVACRKYLGKSVAVKLLKVEYVAIDNIVSRFENEARVMCRLDHPNIREVYDYCTI